MAIQICVLTAFALVPKKASIHGVRVSAAKLKVLFGTGDEIGFERMQRVEPLEIEVGSVHHIVGSRQRDDVVENIHIVHVPLCYQDELGDIAAKIE